MNADVVSAALHKTSGKKSPALPPIAIGIVMRIDDHFETERAINGFGPVERRAVRQPELSRSSMIFTAT